MILVEGSSSDLLSKKPSIYITLDMFLQLIVNNCTYMFFSRTPNHHVIKTIGHCITSSFRENYHHYDVMPWLLVEWLQSNFIY